MPSDQNIPLKTSVYSQTADARRLALFISQYHETVDTPKKKNRGGVFSWQEFSLSGNSSA